MNNKLTVKEAIKLINDHLTLLGLYNAMLERLIASLKHGIDVTPPDKKDRTKLICINCWFNKSFYVSMFFLRNHLIDNCFIDQKWGVPTIEVSIKEQNIELIKSAGLTSSFRKNDINWPLNWDKDSKYYATWEYINKNHPRLILYYESLRFDCEVVPHIDKEDKAIECILAEEADARKYSTELFLQYGEVCANLRNEAYSSAMKKYTLNKYNNEVLLYFMVKFVFPDAVFQYRDECLNDFSLDIYIPSKQFAIEYQGVGHYQSISVFGGDEGFHETQKRDNEKEKLCKKNGIILCLWNYEITINDYNVITRLAAYLHMDFFELRNASRKNLAEYGSGQTCEELLFFASDQRYVRPDKKLKRSVGKSIPKYIYRKYDIDGVFIAQYNSLEEASKSINVKPVTIAKACKGLQNTAGGFQWRKCENESYPTNISKVQEKKISNGALPIYQIDSDGVIIKKFDSIQAASKEIGVDSKNIRCVLNGIQKKAGGYYWDYA